MASNLSSFEQFCGNSPLWNLDLLRLSSYPRFTVCFNQVVLQWIPCMLFLAASIPYLIIISWKKDNPIKAGFLSTAKTCCSTLLLVITIVTVMVRASDTYQDSIPDALYVSEGLKASSFIIATLMIQLDRRKGLVRSSLLWFFWLLLSMCLSFPFIENIMEDVQDDDLFGFVVFYIYFGLVQLSFLLTSIAEERTDLTKDDVQEGPPCPEQTASVPSILSIWWITGLIYKGFKKSLDKQDVFQINPIDQSYKHTLKFEKLWNEETNKVREYNSQVRTTSCHASKISEERKLDEKSPLIPPADEPKAKHSYKTVSLSKVLFKAYGHYFLLSQFLRTASDLLQFLTPTLTEAILKYISYPVAYKEWQGYAMASGFAAILTISAIGANMSAMIARRVGMNVKTLLMNSIYKKSLTVSNIGEELTSGEVINLMSIDCHLIDQITPHVYIFISAPFQIALSIYMLYDKLQEATFAGMAMFLLILPMNIVIGVILGKNQINQMKFKDERMKMANEVLNGIKVLKLYAWEGSFEKKITDIRDKELKVIKSTQLMVALIIYVFQSVPFLVQLTSFAVYISVSDEGYLSPIVASLAMQLFSLLNNPMIIVPVVLPELIQAIVSIGRISKYLNKEDIDTTNVKYDERAVNAIEVEEGEFTWDHNQRSALKDINVAIKPGSLVAVVGMVGSGKSSLLSAILGEMFKLKGNVTVKGSLAYVPQEAWIQNATLKDNILFGSTYHQQRYEEIVEACALKSDLSIFPAGDKTEIGEKGINISGGQKQRVSLARAVYSDNEIYILDDPLSAVDSHVGKHIFKHVMSSSGVLKDKTRVLVTHGIHWLPMVDNIIVMVDGKISEIGTYDELLSTDGAFAQFLKEHIQGGAESDKEQETDPEVEALKMSVLKRLESVTGSSLDESTSGTEGTSETRNLKSRLKHRRRRQTDQSISVLEQSLAGHSGDAIKSSRILKQSTSHVGERLIEEEKEEEGKVGWETYWYYLKVVGSKTIFFGLFLPLCSAGARFFTGIWLSEWTSDDLLLNTSRSDEDEYDETTTRYMVIYGVVGVVQGLFALAFSLLAAVKQTKASGILHKRLLSNILRLPMSFFDTTPIGRIVNRFSRDVDVLDNVLPMNVRDILECLSQILGTILTICYGTPAFLIAFVPLTIVYLIILVLYVPTVRQLRRLDSVSRSPIFSHFSETLNGVSSIRAYKCQGRFLDESNQRIDHNMRFHFASYAVQIWSEFRLQILGNMVVFAAALFAVISSDTEVSMAGVSISYATLMTIALQIIVDNISMAESNIVSVERIREYSSVKREADWVYPCHRPESHWPHEGEMKFQNYETRYRDGLDLVLKDISCHIKGGEKIGIVGRTGAGKSSMTVALFRIIEPAGGQIIIDTQDISSMGLHDLRKKLTILPQDPIIFSGSLRMNLDPFEESSDRAIWDALERCYLKDFVQDLSNGLDYECGEGGSNLSVGQRQLLCLGRTLLRKTKILVLDEATAAVDMETDQLIQKTIKEEFKDSTVLTIAHRLNTIMDYDRVMVLDNGNIREFDAPGNLLSDTTTVFYSMAKNAGLV